MAVKKAETLDGCGKVWDLLRLLNTLETMIVPQPSSNVDVNFQSKTLKKDEIVNLIISWLSIN